MRAYTVRDGAGELVEIRFAIAPPCGEELSIAEIDVGQGIAMAGAHAMYAGAGGAPATPGGGS